MHFLFTSSLRLTLSGLALKIAPGDIVRDSVMRIILHLCTRMYCITVSPKAPTFGAGAKTGHEKITIFRNDLMN